MLKRGVSPLIAALILLMISVGLGTAIVTFFINSHSEILDDTTRSVGVETTCSFDIELSIVEINDASSACYNRSGSDNIEVVLENQGSKSLKGIRMQVIDFNDAVFTESVESPLGAHNRTRYSATYSGIVFPPTKVILSPMIRLNNRNEICTNNQIEIEQMNRCDGS